MVVKTQKALVSKKRTTHGNRPKTGRDSQAQVSLDNAHAVIDGATKQREVLVQVRYYQTLRSHFPEGLIEIRD